LHHQEQQETTMKVTAILFLSLLSTVNAVGSGSIRGEAEEAPLEQLACTFKGGSSQSSCDATKSEDGSSCVWCSVVSYGVCVSEAIAEQMKQTIPGLDCDDDNRSDDDSATDDSTAADDDVEPNDDSVPDDYWTCIEKYSTSAECTAAGCAWCDNKGGYGVCFDKETAKDFDDSDWYSCTEDGTSKIESDVSDPSDPTCLAVTITGDESSCESTKDADGNPCEWCSFQSYEFCLDVDQAQIAEQFGASCGDRGEEHNDAPEVETNDISSPNDLTCIAVTAGGGDETTCKNAMDVEGKPCEWCSFQGYEFCLNVDQAQIADQYGASCGDDAKEEVSDPSDPTCLAVTIGGDESACKGTTDVDGNPCEWCSFQNYEFCLDVDQAQIAEQFGASCSDDVQEENDASRIETNDISSPSDPTCIAVTVGGGDKTSCKNAMDIEGKPCEWCSFQGYEFCLNVDQAQFADQYGVSCGDDVQEEVSDPSDPTCLAVTITGDESSCESTKDADGNPCEWCSFQNYEFCLDVDQAQLAEQFGASCSDDVQEENDASKIETNDVSDPSDPTCLAVTIGGDESACKGTTDVDGNPCEWCSFQNYEFCLDVDQAQIAEQFGASCSDDVEEENDAPKKTDDVSDPSDPTCLAVTITGDESSCESTKDADGNPCEWCSFQSYEFCLDVDQAQIAEQFGASCGDRDSESNNMSTSIA